MHKIWVSLNVQFGRYACGEAHTDLPSDSQADSRAYHITPHFHRKLNKVKQDIGPACIAQTDSAPGTACTKHSSSLGVRRRLGHATSDTQQGR